MPDSARNILVICPTARDRMHFSQPSIRNRYQLHFHGTDELTHEPDFDARLFTERIFERLARTPRAFQGIVGIDDFPACMMAALAAERAGLPGPSFQSLFLCHHKYFSRILQRSAVPHAVPAFQVINTHCSPCRADVRLSFPFFVKPVKSYMSILARQINNFAELESTIEESRTAMAPISEMLDALTGFSRLSPELRLVPSSSLILEELLHGCQVTLDGYVFAGRVVPLGVVDSMFLPNSLSFDRFEYPSRLPAKVQKRMAQIAIDCIRQIKLDSTLFNIEFFYDAENDAIRIIEVNPRMSSQFAPLYRMIDGIDLYSMQLDMALGRDPKILNIWEPDRARDRVSASFVLRTFDDALVVDVPHEGHLESLKRSYPEIFVEILVRRGGRLSDELQDGRTYRYALVDLCAENRPSLYSRFNQVKELLPFRFQSEFGGSNQ